MKEYILGQDDLCELIKELNLNNVKFIFLNGKVGSGKTTLVKEIVASLDITSAVTSPTFSFVNVYESKVFHYDMYNISLEKFISIGLLDGLDEDGIHIFEWGDDMIKNMIKSFGVDVMVINIETLENKNKRVYRIVYG